MLFILSPYPIRIRSPVVKFRQFHFFVSSRQCVNSSFLAFLSCLFLLFLSFSSLSLPFSSCFVFFFSFLSFPLSSFLFFVPFSPIDLCLSCVSVVIDTTCNIYVVVFLGWQSEYFLVSPGVSSETYAPAWTWHIVECRSPRWRIRLSSSLV